MSATDSLSCAAVYLLSGSMQCHQCGKPTTVFGLMALPPFELHGEQDEPDDEDGSVLREIRSMPLTLAPIVRERSRGKWRPDFSRTAAQTYWMNHCEHCDAKQGDHFVTGTDGPFFPYTEADAAAIQAERITGPHVFVEAQTMYSGALAGWRDRRHGVVRQPAPKRRARPR